MPKILKIIYFNNLLEEGDSNAKLSREASKEEEGKLETEKAAVIIQSHFRGYTIRKKFGYELEERYKRILNEYDSKKEAHQALLREGLKSEDASLIVKRWYKTEEPVRKKSPARDPVHPKLRQADLINFAQTVSYFINIYFFTYYCQNYHSCN